MYPLNRIGTPAVRRARDRFRGVKISDVGLQELRLWQRTTTLQPLVPLRTLSIDELRTPAAAVELRRLTCLTNLTQ